MPRLRRSTRIVVILQIKQAMMAKKMPSLVRQLTHVCEAWVVGSAAREDAILENIRDWDVLVPFSHWPEAASILPKNAVQNTFGNWKCVSDGVEIDVWPGDLARFLSKTTGDTIWHPASGKRFKLVK